MPSPQTIDWRKTYTRLLKRGWPPDRAMDTVDALRQRIKIRKIIRARAKQQRLWWARLLRPLTYEMHSVRSGIAYAQTKGGDATPLLGYQKTLDRVHTYLLALKDAGTHTPAQLARERNHEHETQGRGYPIPNNGAHWTDWVPQHIKVKVSGEFLSAVRNPRARARTPFARTLPPDMYVREKEKMAAWIASELDAVERRLLAGDDERFIRKKDRLVRANEALRALKKNEFIPPTWHGLLGDEAEGIDADDDADTEEGE